MDKQAIKNMAGYVPPTSGRKDFLRLDFNENTIGCSPKVLQELRNIEAGEMSMYPDYSELTKAIAGLNKVDPTKIIPTNAGDEGIMLVMNAFIARGDTILLPSPTFAMFKFYAELNGGKIKKIPYKKDLSFPIEPVLDSINKNTRLIVLVNPNNPTGTSINKKDIERILEKAKSSIVLLDEAYYDFTQETCIGMVDSYPNLVILRSFSKAYGLGGLRVGYLISSPENIRLFKKINSPYSITILADRLVTAAIKDYEYVKKYVNEIKFGKEFLYREFSRLGIKFYKGDANFFLADFGNKYKEIYEELKNKNILVRDRNSDFRNCLRITIGTLEQCRKLVYALEEILLKIDFKTSDTLLFDMDGVLVDVSNSYRLAIKKTAELFLKRKISYDEIQKYKERGGLNNDWDCVQAILKDNGFNMDREIIISEFDKIYLGGAIDNEKLIVRKELLKKLSQKYKLGIVTGRPKRDADYTIDKFRLRDFFDIIITLDDVKNGKPDPEGIKKALKLSGSKKAFYFGDTVDDMAAAKKAGIYPVGVIPPLSSKETSNLLIQNGAKYALNNINELLEALK